MTAEKSVSILGATGSIGQNALKVIAHGSGRYRVEALTAMENVEKLAELAFTHRPAFAAIGNPAHYEKLKSALAGSGIRVGAGASALEEAALLPSDTVLSAIVGAAGLKPTLAAICRGAQVAIANKECLVAAGALMTSAAAEHGAKLIPVDSEHSAIFQVFDAQHPEWVESVTITASGGPFRNHTAEQLREVTPESAVKHPNWAMGAKISVDSATLMNKGLELIEALTLFPLKPAQMKVLIHPESVVHSLVAYVDGSVLAQMSPPDMCTPIAYALAWPERAAAPVKKLDLAALGRLTFEEPDTTRFPALALARRVMEQGGSAPVTLNAANEEAVQAFLARRIKFLDIVPLVERSLEMAARAPISTLEDVLAADEAARAIARMEIEKR